MLFTHGSTISRSRSVDRRDAGDGGDSRNTTSEGQPTARRTRHRSRYLVVPVYTQLTPTRYENGKPAATPQYLKWQPNGAGDNELIFVSGHPGRTQRLFTIDQLTFLRDYQYPLQLKAYKGRIEALEKFGNSLRKTSAKRRAPSSDSRTRRRRLQASSTR